MKYWRMIMVMCMFMLLAFQMSQAQDAPVNFNQATPERLLGSYFNAINQGDFATAYTYWKPVSSRLSLEQFTGGYADTLKTEAFFGLLQPSWNNRVKVPTLLWSQHQDNSQHFYTGCYMVVNSPVTTPPDLNYYIEEVSIHEVASMDEAFEQLDEACTHRWSFCQSDGGDCTTPIR